MFPPVAAARSRKCSRPWPDGQTRAAAHRGYGLREQPAARHVDIAAIDQATAGGLVKRAIGTAEIDVVVGNDNAVDRVGAGIGTDKDRVRHGAAGILRHDHIVLDPGIGDRGAVLCLDLQPLVTAGVGLIDCVERNDRVIRGRADVLHCIGMRLRIGAQILEYVELDHGGHLAGTEVDCVIGRIQETVVLCNEAAGAVVVDQSPHLAGMARGIEGIVQNGQIAGSCTGIDRHNIVGADQKVTVSNRPCWPLWRRCKFPIRRNG